MERNLRLLPAYELVRNQLFWLPVFFLFFSARFDVERALALQSAYYLGRVLLEVPSGYLSDRVGRRVTLVLAMAMQAAGGALFATTSSFAAFLAAQLCLAGAWSFVSGTNTALLYDSLRALGREAEIGHHVARLSQRGFLGLASASLAGGLLAGVDARIAYALTGAAGLGGLALAWRMAEPPRASLDEPDLAHRLPDVVRRLGDRTLLWVFAFAVAMHVFNHVPFEFLQPWLDPLAARLGAEGYSPTPALAGGTIAVMMLASAAAAGRAMAVRRRLGSAPTLLAAMALQGAIIGGMALALHPAVVPLVALRSVPHAISFPVQEALIHPRVPSSMRATYLSVQSLAGSLALALCLLLAARATGGIESLDPETLSGVLGTFWVALAAAFLVLALARGALRDSDRPDPPPTP